MKDIHIPPAALEAGARAIAEKNFFGSDLMSPRLREHHQALARAAFVAMVENWPGCEEDDLGPAYLILPLAQKQENSDD